MTHTVTITAGLSPSILKIIAAYEHRKKYMRLKMRERRASGKAT